MLNEMDTMQLDVETLNGLAAGFRGDVITRTDPTYDEARRIYSPLPRSS